MYPHIDKYALCVGFLLYELCGLSWGQRDRTLSEVECSTLHDRIRTMQSEKWKSAYASYADNAANASLVENSSERANSQPVDPMQLLKDIEYVNRMHELEIGQERVLDVVPVGGLVVGTFVRIQNELKTVLMLWDQSDMKDSKDKDHEVRAVRLLTLSSCAGQSRFEK